MAGDIRLLEDRVAKAVKRLERLTAERDSLREEVDALRAKTNGDEGENRERAWKGQRAEVVAALRETLTELRGD